MHQWNASLTPRKVRWQKRGLERWSGAGTGLNWIVWRKNRGREAASGGISSGSSVGQILSPPESANPPTGTNPRMPIAE